MELNKIYNCDCLEYMKTLDDESVDCIITDPPYLYLKHKLDLQFDEKEFFKQAYRILTKKGFLVFFGRGTSFHKWNYICSKIGFKFKEEIIWDKRHPSSPFGSLGRIHEIISIYTKKKGIINKVKVDRLKELRNCKDFKKLENDIKRIISFINKCNSMEMLEEFKSGNYNITINKGKHSITTTKNKTNKDRSFLICNMYKQGQRLNSIITEQKEHYIMEHPTQKPVELIKKLILLCSNKNDIVFDGFLGSGTTALACIETDRKFIGCEIDKDYFEIAENRINKALENKESMLF